MTGEGEPPEGTTQLRDMMRAVWGYDTFRPLQLPAMQAVLDSRDSLVVMPTGGGKSLCYQVPALIRSGVAVVVSPLISLMKDQVDALLACGVEAACINSTLSSAERIEVADGVRSGRLKLLYMAPERLMMPRTLDFLAETEISMIAVDEAHCISEWGHDFRPEYRELRQIKDRLPGIALHAFTATATEAVRDDIVRQLGLKDPHLLVGSFDRPNLHYRVERRADRLAQIRAVIDRHPDESGIVYCIRRADVDEIADQLRAHGYQALPYHAGLEDRLRHRHQEFFIQEKADIIVATVAFGMGIDKSNVRYVVHAGMPKSLENYQQESGRAGRDGLAAECCVLYSGSDVRLWKSMLGDLPRDAHDAALDSLMAMERFCTGHVCRHRTIVEYFGQSPEAPRCQACDVCCEPAEPIADPLRTAQMILSCVVRLEQRFGADYTAKVICGSRDKKILDLGHDRLSTYALLADHGTAATRHWIDQLIAQEFLLKSGEYAVLNVTEAGWSVLKGGTTPRLTEPPRRTGKAAKTSAAAPAADWEGVDRALFDQLRDLRRSLAEERSIPAFVVFGDVSLRDMARHKPADKDQFRQIKGVGDKKCAEYAEVFLECIARSNDANPGEG